RERTRTRAWSSPHGRWACRCALSASVPVHGTTPRRRSEWRSWLPSTVVSSTSTWKSPPPTWRATLSSSVPVTASSPTAAVKPCSWWPATRVSCSIPVIPARPWPVSSPTFVPAGGRLTIPPSSCTPAAHQRCSPTPVNSASSWVGPTTG
ncbi:uncharacterized protein METZ01_LOCUS384050, partial [marine metagenome]